MIKKTLIGVGLITAIGVFGDVQAAGLEDFEDQKTYEEKMTCFNSDQNKWVVVAKEGDTITMWVKNRPKPNDTRDIIDRDESEKKYVTRQRHMTGENINLYDFENLEWNSKTPFGRVSYDCR